MLWDVIKPPTSKIGKENEIHCMPMYYLPNDFLILQNSFLIYRRGNIKLKKKQERNPDMSSVERNLAEV